MSEPTNKRIGDYEILNELGAGGMGKVYRVRNVIFDRIEAMKVLLPDLAGRQELADRFLREVKLMASLNHPNIAALRTAFIAENQLVMIMEFVEGTNLAQRVELGPIPVTDAVNYIGQALSALSYAHQHGVIHRDIKPSNMMLTPQGAVKLMDFGIARADSEKKLTMSGTTLGSIGYMSPEQVKGEPTDARSDLYSTGISLYEMVTGRRPFQEASDYNIMAAHVREKPKPPLELQPGLPVVLNEIILMSIAKDPAQRFQSAEAMRNALATVQPLAGAAPIRVPTSPQATLMEAPTRGGADATLMDNVRPAGLPPTLPSASAMPDVTAPMAAAGGIERKPGLPPTVPSASAMPDVSAPVPAAGGIERKPGLPPTVPSASPVPGNATTPIAATAGLNRAAIPSAVLLPTPGATPTPIPTPVPPPPSGHRGLYMTLGALVVLAGLVLAGLYLPSSSRTHAKAPDATAVSPAPDVGSQTVTQPAPSAAPSAATAVPNSTQPAPPPLAVADNPASTQPQIPPVTAPQSAKPDLGQKAAPPAMPHAGKLTAKHNAMAGAAAPAQSDAGTAPPNDASAGAPGDAPDSLDAVEHDVDQLSNRAAAVSSGLNRLQQQQSAAGYGLRGDMVERGASMNANLAKAEEAMRNGNLMRARRFAKMAENDIDILERFLGR
jgi:serine/threonine-protein kinase